MNNNQPKKHVVFGAAGNTGKQMLPLLLEAGHSVRAFVRTPSKLLIQHVNLEIVQGDITNPKAVRDAIKGMDAVISLVGGPLRDKSYKGGLLLPFIKTVHEAMRANGINKLLLQTGAASKIKGEKYNFLRDIIVKKIDGPLRGDHGVHIDNDAAINYLESNANDIDWIITRPPLLVDEFSTRKVMGLDKICGLSANYFPLAELCRVYYFNTCSTRSGYFLLFIF
jgi:putative NADH-flavin reductase